MTGFDIIDRYDIAASLLIGAAVVAALMLGIPLWGIALIVMAAYIGIFVRHFDQIMRS